MRAFKFLLFFFFITSFLIASKALAEAAFNPYRKFCTGIQGKFIARNWKGGPIQVGCAGDSGSYTSNPDQRCVGEVQTVYPGEKFRLTKCSCFGSDKGCLKVGKELRREPLVNGKRKITVVRRIQDMAAFTNNSCTINKTSNICGSNGDRIKGNVKIRCQVPLTPTPPICPVPEKVTNVRVNCPNCFGEVPS
ncbi:MAG: hypothetical protein HYW63_04225 [Candidatus Levybacteria bacterium]|nr:hypothetical protein [Candidatus Levybacteria bacterium]